MTKDLYDFFNNLHHKFNPRDWVWDYKNGAPVPHLILDNFLPDAIFQQVAQEAKDIPEYYWNEFTRNGSYMKECKAFNTSPVSQSLVHCFNSGVFINWLEQITEKKKIISDPHLIGAGLSRSEQGHSLKLHTDFNWNDELALNRSLSMIFYINPQWDPSWGGGLEFWDFDRTAVVQNVSPMPNRLLLWHYDDRFIHGYPAPLACPADQQRMNLRIFYYHSNATPSSKPHRSLYWWDEQSKTPLDDRRKK
jgi:hypothetical protein